METDSQGKSRTCQHCCLLANYWILVIVEELYDCDSDLIDEDDIVKEEQIFQCSSCDFSFTDVNEHLQKYHDINEQIVHQNEPLEEDQMVLEELNAESDSEISLAPIVKNEDGKYECNECQKSFKNYKRFVTHLKSHNSLMVEDFSELEQNVKKHNDYVQIEGTDGTMFRCNHCSADFASRKRLLLHLTIHKNVTEAQSKEKLFGKQSTDIINCQICNKSFSNKLEFELHVQAHDENSPSTSKAYIPKKSQIAQKGVHPCQYCGKIFKRPHEKVKHEVSCVISSIGS
jgi:uncharacterized C2H2 Zn-finger protein